MYNHPCVTCLTRDRRLIKLRKNSKLFSLLKGLIQCALVTSKFTYVLCWECISQLNNISSFQNKARTSIKILTDIYSKSTDHSKKDLKSLTNLSISKVNHFHIDGLGVKTEEDEPGRWFHDFSTEQLNFHTVDVKFSSDYEDVPSTSFGTTDSHDDFTTSDNETLFKFKIKKQSNDILPIVKSDSDTESASSTEKYIQTEKKSIMTNKSLSDDRKSKPKKVTFKESNSATSIDNLSQIYSNSENIIKGNRSVYNNVEGTHSLNDFYTNYMVGCYKRKKKQSLNWTVNNLTENELLELRERSRCEAEYVSRAHKCESCIQGFFTKEHLVEHRRKYHHQSLGNIICEVCLRVFGTGYAFRKHYYTHFIYRICDECGFSHHSHSTMTLHQRRMHQHLPNPRSARGLCQTNSGCSDGRNVTTELRRFKCDCGKLYRTKTALQLHKSKKHTEMKWGHYCVVCKKFYKDKVSYRAHVRTAKGHLNDYSPRFECDDCGRRYPFKRYLEQHIMFTHLGIRAYKCDLCDKQYSSLRGLKCHKVNSHSSLVPTRDKICDVCGAAFTTMAILNSHMVRHTGARPYACDQCSATFGFSGAMYTHKKLVHKSKVKGRPKPQDHAKEIGLPSDVSILQDYADVSIYGNQI